MIDTKLIMVEGIPGSGKSTTAVKIKEYLDSIGVTSKLYLESDCYNPSDFAWISILTQEEYDKLIKDYPEHNRILKQYSEKSDVYTLVYYQKMKNEAGLHLPEEMIKFLYEHEPYDGRVSSDKFMPLLLNRYEQFSKEAAKLREVTVFESSFLQNLVNELMGFQNRRKSYRRDQFRRGSKKSLYICISFSKDVFLYNGYTFVRIYPS